MRVAYLVSKYPDVSHTFILREVMGLRALGMEIAVASINEPRALTEQERDEVGKTFYVKRAGAGGALTALGWALAKRPGGVVAGFTSALGMAGYDLKRVALGVFYFLEALILARWMDSLGLSHLHVHFATPAATVAVIVTKVAPVTLSMTVHGPDEFYDVPGYALVEKVRASRFVVCISFFAQSQMMKIADGAEWGKFEIGRLGVDAAVFAARVAPVDDGVFRVLCVGRLVGTKGQRILIRAVQRLAAEGRTLELRLVGDGPDRDALEAMVHSEGLGGVVKFEGSVGQDRIREFYRAADCFALASFAEGIPVVLMEAMAMEIPVVSSSINGIPELIENGVDGMLVAPSDVDGLADALGRLMDDPGLRVTLGKAGRAKVLAEYELAGSVQRLEAIFRGRLG